MRPRAKCNTPKSARATPPAAPNPTSPTPTSGDPLLLREPLNDLDSPGKNHVPTPWVFMWVTWFLLTSTLLSRTLPAGPLAVGPSAFHNINRYDFINWLFSETCTCIQKLFTLIHGYSQFPFWLLNPFETCVRRTRSRELSLRLVTDTEVRNRSK